MIDQIAIEPALTTVALRLKRIPGHLKNKNIVFELNTSGFGAVDLPVRCVSGERVVCDKVEWTRKRMAQAARTTKTKYSYIDISAVREGNEFILVQSSVVFNSAQDQTCRLREIHPALAASTVGLAGSTAGVGQFLAASALIAGRSKCDVDWWGMRLYPNVRNANLAVRLPRTRAYKDVRRMKRLEGSLEGSKEWQEIKKGDLDFEPAGDMVGSYNDGDWVVWVIPPDSDKGKTIYSIHWRWADNA